MKNMFCLFGVLKQLVEIAKTSKGPCSQDQAPETTTCSWG